MHASPGKTLRQAVETATIQVPGAFKALVLGRIIEPTSKVDTIRVLGDLGVPSPSRATFRRCLQRTVERDYRSVIAHACYAHATRTGSLALVLYDLTKLHFETDKEDSLRKVGMSNYAEVAVMPRSGRGCRCSCWSAAWEEAVRAA